MNDNNQISLPSQTPHIYVDLKKRSLKQWFLIAFMSLTVLSVPLGVYLVSQDTNALPQAASPNTPALETSLSLETPKTSVTDGEEFPVYIKVRSDLDDINLISANLSFPPKNFEVTRIDYDSTGSQIPNGTFINPDWLDLNFNNETGTASLIGGIPNPGFKTDDKINYYLAAVYLRAKGSTKIQITLSNQSGLFRSSDNQNVLKEKKGLNMTLSYSVSSTPAPKPIIKPSLFDSTPSGLLTSPTGGSVYSYYKTVPIEWNVADLKIIKELNLYMNSKLFGKLGSDLDNSGRVLWQPNKTILLPFVSPQNTFQIELVAQTKTDQIVKSKTAPFGLLPQSDFTTISATTSSSLNLQGKDSLGIASELFSNYALPKPTNPEVDLNSDGVVNNLDLYLLRSLLITKGSISN